MDRERGRERDRERERERERENMNKNKDKNKTERKKQRQKERRKENKIRSKYPKCLMPVTFLQIFARTFSLSAVGSLTCARLQHKGPRLSFVSSWKGAENPAKALKRAFLYLFQSTSAIA